MPKWYKLSPQQRKGLKMAYLGVFFIFFKKWGKNFLFSEMGVCAT